MAHGSHRFRFSVPPLQSLRDIREAEEARAERRKPQKSTPTDESAESQCPRCGTCPSCGSSKRTPPPERFYTTPLHQKGEDGRARPVEYVGGGVAAPLDERLQAQKLQKNEMERLEADLRSAGFAPKTAPRDADEYGAAVREFVLLCPGKYPVYEEKQAIGRFEGKRPAKSADRRVQRWEQMVDGNGECFLQWVVSGRDDAARSLAQPPGA